MITFTNQLTASVLQPVVGTYTDKRPQPFSLTIGMGFTLVGLVMLSMASSYPLILSGGGNGRHRVVRIPSGIFSRRADGVGRPAWIRTIDFPGGWERGIGLGSSAGSIYCAAPRADESGMVLTGGAAGHGAARQGWDCGPRRIERRARWRQNERATTATTVCPSSKVKWSIAILVVLVFSKYIYLASLTSYYTFYLINKFHVSVQNAQVYLFVFLGAVALGTILGGPIGDRVGRKYVIWCSILGILPFTLAMPYVNLFWTVVLSAIIGTILASAFPAIVVYAQELLPGKVGMISGLFFGLAFGTAGIAAALLGELADHTSIDFVYRACAFMPLLGLLTVFLPDLEGPMRRGAKTQQG